MKPDVTAPARAPYAFFKNLVGRYRIQLAYYYRPDSPEAMRLLAHIVSAGLAARIVCYDTYRDLEAYWRLITLVGEEAVPCLVIDDIPLADASDIRGWLDGAFGAALARGA